MSTSAPVKREYDILIVRPVVVPRRLNPGVPAPVFPMPVKLPIHAFPMPVKISEGVRR